MTPITFNTTGSFTYTVPVTGTYTITAAGIAGGSATGSNIGGSGAEITAAFNFTQGQQLIVSGLGGDGVRKPGGGGFTGIYAGPANSSVPLLIAGGGGGGSGRTTDGGAGIGAPGALGSGGAGGLTVGSGGGGAGAAGGLVLIAAPAPCYVTGTHIRVLRGLTIQDVPVERLRVGDLALTASGKPRPIRWIGSRTLDLHQLLRPQEGMPVRIRAGALGHHLPIRDLLLSPDHAVRIGPEHGLTATSDAGGPGGADATAHTARAASVLVPAFALVNGATVTRAPTAAVTYWHVELADGHDLLLAEGVAAESYLDCGNRGFFTGPETDSKTVVDAHRSDGPNLAALVSCLPRTDDPARLAPVRAWLRERAQALGWTCEVRDPLGGLHLVADGIPVRPEVEGLSALFLVPAGAGALWLVCGASVPWEVSDARDARRLGACVAGLTLADGWGETRALDLRDTAFDTAEAGWYGAEVHGGGVLRWTAGRARLPAARGAGRRGAAFLRVDLARPVLPVWRPPVGLRVGPPAVPTRDPAIEPFA